MTASRGIVQHTSMDPQTKEAIDNKDVLVALESAPIAYGWDRERGLQVLHATFDAVVTNGAVPAVFWIEKGKIRVSSDPEEVEKLAGNRTVTRVSRGTLASALAAEVIGATTISATMMMAHQVGIPTLAVGGIGGVHLGAFGPDPTLDVSPDIDELSRTQMIVVSSGPKIILDIPATLEMLETRGVPLVSLGSPYVPGYFVKSTPHRAPINASSIEEAAQIASVHLSLDTGTAMLLCVPIPSQAAIPVDVLIPVVEEAQAEIRAQNLRGGKATSTILTALSQATNGKTEDALEAVTVANAAAAAKIATRLNGQ